MRVKKIYFIMAHLCKARLYMPIGTASNYHDPLNKKKIRAGEDRSQLNINLCSLKGIDIGQTYKKNVLKILSICIRIGSHRQITIIFGIVKLCMNQNVFKLISFSRQSFIQKRFNCLTLSELKLKFAKLIS